MKAVGLVNQRLIRDSGRQNGVPTMSSRTNTMLRQACEDAVLIRFWNPYDEGSTHGYVLDIGPKFFFLALIGEDMRFNGFQCMKVKDAKRLQVPDPYADFIVTALRKRGQTIRKKPNVDVSDLSALLISANRLFPLVTIHREGVEPGCCWIGRVIEVTDKHLTLHEIGTHATWHKKPCRYRLSEITRVEFGGGYEEALHLVGGDLKRQNKQARSKKA